MPDAAAAIRAHWPDTVMLGKTISERLPTAVIEFVMESLVRKFPSVFDINGVTEEILPAAGLPLGAGGRVREGRREWGRGGGRTERKRGRRERGVGEGKVGDPNLTTVAKVGVCQGAAELCSRPAPKA